MSNEKNTLIFTEIPEVVLGSNTFHKTPVVLQVDDTPIIELVPEHSAGFTTQITIYDEDGTYITKVKGSQLYLTEEAEKAGLTLRHPGLVTVLERGKKTLFELRREHAAALKMSAELYAPNGAFVKTNSTSAPSSVLTSPDWIIARVLDGAQVGIKDFVITGRLDAGKKCIGMHVVKDSHVILGVGCKVEQFWKGAPQDLLALWPQLPPGKVASNVKAAFLGTNPSEEEIRAKLEQLTKPTG